jgi:hypothetical protein
MAIILKTILLTAVSALLYRLGGWGHGFNTKVRDMGVPTCMLALMAWLGLWHWSLILCFGLMFGAQTTYFKKSGTDAMWYNWLAVGVAFGLAMLPYAAATGQWLGFGARFVIVAFYTVVWSEMIGQAWIEESGRGAIQIATLPLLLLQV